MPASRVTYDFDFDEKFEYSVVAAADVSLYAEPRPGIYAWFIRVLKKADPVVNMAAYDGVFASKRLTVEASGHLGEKYTGKLKKQPFFTSDSASFHDTILAASTIFCPPVYIGISKGIKGRLETHIQALEAALQRPPSPDDDTSSISDDDLDSDAESNVFGERMGRILRTNQITTTRPLFVKIIYGPGPGTTDLRKAETYVNRTFILMCGRK